MSIRLKDKDSIDSLLKEMSVREKLVLLTGGSIYRTAELEKYGIPGALVIDGGTGINSMQIGMELGSRASRVIYGEPPVDEWCTFENPRDQEGFDCHFTMVMVPILSEMIVRYGNSSWNLKRIECRIMIG